MIVLPRRLSDEVADRVRALIDEKNLEAGMKLPAERQLAMQLGVSRNSLREALAKLVSEGVLLSRRGGGTFIRWRLCFTEDCRTSKKPRMVCSSTMLCEASAIAR